MLAKVQRKKCDGKTCSLVDFAQHLTTIIEWLESAVSCDANGRPNTNLSIALHGATSSFCRIQNSFNGDRKSAVDQINDKCNHYKKLLADVRQEINAEAAKKLKGPTNS